MGSVVKNPPAMRRPRFDPWIGKIPWRRAWLRRLRGHRRAERSYSMFKLRRAAMRRYPSSKAHWLVLLFRTYTASFCLEDFACTMNLMNLIITKTTWSGAQKALLPRWRHPYMTSHPVYCFLHYHVVVYYG